MKLHMAILPPAQREFWDAVARTVPKHFVLYGGTAVALRFGHRASVDFDLFTDQRFRYEDLASSIPALNKAVVLQRAESTLDTNALG